MGDEPAAGPQPTPQPAENQTLFSRKTLIDLAVILALGAGVLLLARLGCGPIHLPNVAAPPSVVQLTPDSSIEVGPHSVTVRPPRTPGQPQPAATVVPKQPESRVKVDKDKVTVSHSGICLVPFVGGTYDSGFKGDFYWNAGARVYFTDELGLEFALNERREYLRLDWRPGGWNLLLAAGPAAPLATISVDGLSAAAQFVLADF